MSVYLSLSHLMAIRVTKEIVKDEIIHAFSHFGVYEMFQNATKQISVKMQVFLVVSILSLRLQQICKASHKAFFKCQHATLLSSSGAFKSDNAAECKAHDTRERYQTCNVHFSKFGQTD